MSVKPGIRQRGFGLVELMVGMVISMIILAAASEVLLSSLTSNRDSIRMARLDQELRQVMTMVSRDARRATIWDPAIDVARLSMSVPIVLSGTSGTVTVTSSGDLGEVGAKAAGATLIYVSGSTVYRATINSYDSGTDTFSATVTGTAWPATEAPAGTWSILRPAMAITTDAVAGTPGSCLMFAYDTNADGTYGTGEYFGYRYDATDDAVEIRTSGAAGNTCTTGGTWQNLTDDLSVEVTAFTVTENSPTAVTSSGLSVAVREFTISITGHLIADPAVQRTLQETVRIRNEQMS
jgi:prepilin-type N-terminal cleavage/methylation domain-containing protein